MPRSTESPGCRQDASGLFTDAMALTPIREETGSSRRVFDAELDEHWTIGPKVHGGAMLALCANAARAALGGGRQPIAISGNFLWAPDPGPMRVSTTVRKDGRRVGLVDFELTQDLTQKPAQQSAGGDTHPRGVPRTAVRGSVTLGEPEHHVTPLLSVNPVVDVMPPEPPPGVEPIGPGHPMAHIVNLAHGCDIRPVLSSMGPRTDGGPPVIQMWVRPRGVAPDVLFALLCGDVSAPVTRAVNRTGWAPTVQLTAYLRAVPADGWLRVVCTAMQIGQDWFDEDHVVVDCEGRIIVQSRQLAMVPPP